MPPTSSAYTHWFHFQRPPLRAAALTHHSSAARYQLSTLSNPPSPICHLIKALSILSNLQSFHGSVRISLSASTRPEFANDDTDEANGCSQCQKIDRRKSLIPYDALTVTCCVSSYVCRIDSKGDRSSSTTDLSTLSIRHSSTWCGDAA